MNANQLMRGWVIWRETVRLLEEDERLFQTMTMPLKLSYHTLIRFLLEGAKAMEYVSKRDVQKNDIRILGNYEDSKEIVVLWKHRGQTHMYRQTKSKLRTLAQKQVVEMKTFINNRGTPDMTELWFDGERKKKTKEGR